jgi:glycosyltransferase involved in cell wall biosynthesis
MDPEQHLSKSKKVAVVAASISFGVTGGAERFYDGLMQGLRDIGCDPELIALPADEPSFDAIVDNYRSFSMLDLSKFDAVISSKAPTYAVSHSNHVIYHNHTVRFYYDMFSEKFPIPEIAAARQRKRLFELDYNYMSSAKAIISQGHETANRLYRWLGLKSKVLHAPVTLPNLRIGGPGDYFFMPGRLHPWKRVDLVIDAVRRSSLPMRLIISGTGEAEEALRERAANDPRIEFVGRVDDDKLVELYANALAVCFVPIREDYGYVTVEAFLSGKAVITCPDSGEPTYFVRNGETGLVCDPDPEHICAGLERLFTNKIEAERMGRASFASIANLPSWKDVASELMSSALGPRSAASSRKRRVTVLDMQPIDPPTGGGRLRLLGLYHALGEDIDCRYIGTYDWRGEKFRKHRLSHCLEATYIPLSLKHHEAADRLRSEVGGKTVIDLAFGRLAHLSPDYVSAARESVRDADIVAFSHPWVYSLVADALMRHQIVIYDSHNVEGYLRAQLLDRKNPTQTNLLRQVVEDEYALGCRADLIFACSQEDLERFARIYDFPCEKMRIVPNGAMAFAPGQQFNRPEARRSLGLRGDALIAIFIGSAFGPNVEAARFIADQLANALPEVTFVIAGGVGDELRCEKTNVIITGRLEEAKKLQWLAAADVGLNPMFSGSGTNIKMFDLMAMNLPIISTATGTRGIECAGRNAILTVEADAPSFAIAIRRMFDERLRSQMGEAARACLEDGYAWERISPLTGALMEASRGYVGQPQPFFTVVVPSYERHEALERLFERLRAQVERDFEVIVVDQSKMRWSGADRRYGFPLLYWHTPVKGVIRARNTGATLAQGHVIAFTDDDCLPDELWLFNARKHFAHLSVVGVEGRIVSNHLGDPNWRPVTNVGLEGVFMSANLMVRQSVFQCLGGYDFQFDHPHFREDTDFGWRIQEVGAVPYATDVMVFHPAQPRSLDRESVETRARFFEKDAVLFRKHPQRYKELFFRERQYAHNKFFSFYLKEGFKKLSLNVPSWIDKALKSSVSA